MDAYQTKRLVNAIAVCAIVAIIVSLILIVTRKPKPIAVTPAPVSPTFSHLICDDAYKSEKHYEKLNPPYIDVKLTEPCFSGFVSLPDKWSTWQTQFRGDDGSDWMAQWYEGATDPAGRYTHSIVNGGGLPKVAPPSKRIRFEGKGTLRLYRLTADTTSPPPGATNTAGIASTSDTAATPSPSPKDPAPILPISGASKDYSLVLEECSRNSEKVDCWGYMTSKNDAPAEAYLHVFDATDDEGNAFRGTIGLENQHLAPGVKTRWNATFSEAHANAHSATLQLRVHFGVHGEFADNDELVFDHIPFDQKKAPIEK